MTRRACVLAAAAPRWRCSGPPPAHAAFPGRNGRIAYAAERDVSSDVWSVLPDGSRPRRLTGTGLDYDPSWSPGGGRIAFESQRDLQSDVWLMTGAGRASAG